jgi:hypothetical protein
MSTSTLPPPLRAAPSRPSPRHRVPGTGAMQRAQANREAPAIHPPEPFLSQPCSSQSLCPFVPIVPMSLCPFVAMSLCPSVAMSLCPSVPLSLLSLLSLCPSVPLSLYPRPEASAGPGTTETPSVFFPSPSAPGSAHSPSAQSPASPSAAAPSARQTPPETTPPSPDENTQTDRRPSSSYTVLPACSCAQSCHFRIIPRGEDRAKVAPVPEQNQRLGPPAARVCS